MTTDLDLTEIHTFACQLAIDAGSYLRDQALARASRARGAAAYDLELTIKENAAVSPVKPRVCINTHSQSAGPCHEGGHARRGDDHGRNQDALSGAQVLRLLG